MKRKALVTGATGRQGGSVARQLIAKEWEVLALTRDVSKASSKSLELLGATLVMGSMDNRDEMLTHLKGLRGHNET